MARRREIRLIRGIRRVRSERLKRPGGHPCLIGTDAGGFFRAVLARGVVSARRCQVETEALQRLELQEGDPIYACAV